MTDATRNALAKAMIVAIGAYAIVRIMLYMILTLIEAHTLWVPSTPIFLLIFVLVHAGPIALGWIEFRLNLRNPPQ